MKNAREYEKKVRKLLGGMGKAPAPAPADPAERIPLLIQSILEEDASSDQAAQAYRALMEEFVDLNELRVSPAKEIVEHLGKDYPAGRLKAETLTGALDTIFDKTCTMTVAYVDKLSKRDLRRHLREIGLSPYAAADVVLRAFGGHAVPVGLDLVEVLEMDGCVHPGSDVADVQGFLERIIPQKDALAARTFLREYIEKHRPALTDKRRKEALVRQEAERQKARAEAAAKAQADRKAAEAAARQAAKQAKAAARKAALKARSDSKKKAAAEKKKVKAPKARGTSKKK